MGAYKNDYSKRHFLDFEEPLQELAEQIIHLKNTESNSSNLDLSDTIQKLEKKILKKREEIAKTLNTWQRIQLSRHPDRPYALCFIEHMCSEFIELYGDRNFKDDKAIVCGIGKISDKTVMIVAQQKGKNTKMRQYRNFGMANPEGYRKALRIMRLAEKFNIPVISLIDTPGAYPGIEAEDRGQGEAIARNIYEMLGLKVPIICTVIGEGASGGALGIGVGDITLMFQNAWYSVIAPESCSTILWRTPEKKEIAAEQLKPTSDYMLKFGLVDEIVPEPYGGSHWDPKETAENLKKLLLKHLNVLISMSEEERIQNRIHKYQKMGFYNEK